MGKQREKRWRERDGVIYFSVMSDGTTGGEWAARLRGEGFHMDNNAQNALHSPDFKPTNGVACKVAVLKGTLFSDADRDMKNVRAEAARRNLKKPNAEVACLTRQFLTDEDLEAMGFGSLVIVHNLIKGSHLFGIARTVGGRRFYVCKVTPDTRWHYEVGFAFAVSQT